jgi:integrase
VPDARGVHLKRSKKQVIVPYDLRHTWAVTVATSSDWNHVSDVEAAACMGHDIEVHRRNYQKWISVDETRKTIMRKITFQ